MATMTVLEFPPRLSFNIHVKTESLYGTKLDFFDLPLACKIKNKDWLARHKAVDREIQNYLIFDVFRF